MYTGHGMSYAPQGYQNPYRSPAAPPASSSPTVQSQNPAPSLSGWTVGAPYSTQPLYTPKHTDLARSQAAAQAFSTAGSPFSWTKKYGGRPGQSNTQAIAGMAAGDWANAAAQARNVAYNQPYIDQLANAQHLFQGQLVQGQLGFQMADQAQLPAYLRNIYANRMFGPLYSSIFRLV